MQHTIVIQTITNVFIVSAWNDGIIRAFAPHTGNLHFSIFNAHTKAVSTIAATSDGTTLISGGCDGQVIYFTSYKTSFNNTIVSDWLTLFLWKD